MRKPYKILALLLITSILSTFLVGCSSDERTLYNAFIKTQSITSYENKLDLSFRIECDGLFGEDEAPIQSAIILLNNLKLNFNQKTMQDKSKGILKSKINTNIDTGGLSINTDLWVNIDPTLKDPVMKEIIKIPVLAQLALPFEHRNKQYLVIDLNESQEAEKPDQEQLKALTNKFTDFFNEYISKLNVGVTIASLSEKALYNNIPCETYEVKIDDAALKKIIRYMGEDILKNKDALNIFKEFLEYSINNAIISDKEKEEAKKEIETVLKAFEDSIPDSLKQFNYFMDTFNNVKLLGENGIKIKYVVNDKGYIVKSSGSMDFNINIQEIQNAVIKYSGIESSSKDKLISPLNFISFGIDFNSETTNINGNFNIDLPTLTETNSFNINDFYSSDDFYQDDYLGDYDDEDDDSVDTGELEIYINDDLVNFKSEIITKDGKLLVPAREFFEKLGGFVIWNDDKETITGIVGKSSIQYKIGSSDVIVKGKNTSTDVIPILVNDISYIPLRFTAESLNCYIEWDSETNSVYIYP